MNENNKQLFNGILIIVGGALLIYTLTVTTASIYTQILGIIFLMVGAYRASKHWSIHKNDHLDE
ncbi:hypothetical protein [Nonlabens ponticola]|uniref:Uncharacterized protein n=1 Tax=Nonlabens ponticola TaxID=2496866 RepID=A0A3S9MX16_9FLAO|nr:hypothetical protein [Nonlabens ponticola]AZQ43771.1 hypothetical protein EJ995_05835 [Nonlabens ponticola]